MKGFLSEPFVDRISAFSADWLKFSLNPTNHQSKRKKISKKRRNKLENQLVVCQYIPELKSLSFLSVGVSKDPNLR